MLSKDLDTTEASKCLVATNSKGSHPKCPLEDLRQNQTHLEGDYSLCELIISVVFEQKIKVFHFLLLEQLRHREEEDCKLPKGGCSDF